METRVQYDVRTIFTLVQPSGSCTGRFLGGNKDHSEEKNNAHTNRCTLFEWSKAYGEDPVLP
jgi:hypothetical protein